MEARLPEGLRCCAALRSRPALTRQSALAPLSLATVRATGFVNAVCSGASRIKAERKEAAAQPEPKGARAIGGPDPLSLPLSRHTLLSSRPLSPLATDVPHSLYAALLARWLPARLADRLAQSGVRRTTRSALAAMRFAEIQRAGRAAADRRHAAPSTRARPTGAGRADHDHVSAAQAEPSRAEPAA